MRERGPGGPRALVEWELTLLSFGAGCMDIISYRGLGEVFTSAMTGNMALLGLAIGQGNFERALHNGAALAGFLAGLVLGALLLRSPAAEPGWSRATDLALAVEALLLSAFAALWFWGGPEAATARYGLIALSALAMGVQSAAAHSVGVAGISTTYFTGSTASFIFGVVEGRKPKPATPQFWPIVALLAYVGGAALTGLLGSRFPLAVAAVPACIVVVVLAAALFDGWRSNPGAIEGKP